MQSCVLLDGRAMSAAWRDGGRRCLPNACLLYSVCEFFSLDSRQTGRPLSPSKNKAMQGSLARWASEREHVVASAIQMWFLGDELGGQGGAPRRSKRRFAHLPWALKQASVYWLWLDGLKEGSPSSFSSMSSVVGDICGGWRCEMAVVSWVTRWVHGLWRGCAVNVPAAAHYRGGRHPIYTLMKIGQSLGLLW